MILQQKRTLRPQFDACILCLTVAKEVLDQRIDLRVDNMVKKGLLKEVEEVWTQLTQSGNKMANHTFGILQAIGLKEFAPFFAQSQLGNISDLGKSDQIAECVQAIKNHTRQYSRKQMRWIDKLVDGDGSCCRLPITYLDSTDIAQWQSLVYAPAITSVQSFLSSSFLSTTLPEELFPKEEKENKLALWKKYACDVCDGKMLNGSNEWRQHLQCSSHRKKAKHMRKLQTQHHHQHTSPMTNTEKKREGNTYDDGEGDLMWWA